VTATAEAPSIVVVPRVATPCLAWDAERCHCVAGLLLGVACCPHGDCAICEERQERMRRAGRPELEVARAWLASRAGRLDRCPACGFPPPPPLVEMPALPRFDRSDRVLEGAQRCRYCDRRLLGTRRRYCDDDCWRAFVVWSRGLARAGVARV
jgi:hypothetical protein